MKIVQQGKRETRKECNMEIAKHEKIATRKKSNIKKCSTKKTCKMKEKSKHGKSGI